MDRGLTVIEVPPRFSLYVDGSCIGNQHVDADTPAGWGLVIVEKDTGLGKRSGEFVEEFRGKVITNRDDEKFIGAEIGSNNTAELSAFLHALRWILTRDGDEPCEICTDSKYAGHIADGSWRAKTNKDIASRVQSLWKDVSILRPLSWRHVRAHQGHKWNERADHLAKRVVNDENPIPLDFWKPGQN